MDSHASTVEHVEDEEDIARVKLSHMTQTLIVEAVDELPDHLGHADGVPRNMCAWRMPDYGMILKSWLKSQDSDAQSHVHGRRFRSHHPLDRAVRAPQAQRPSPVHLAKPMLRF